MYKVIDNEVIRKSYADSSDSKLYTPLPPRNYHRVVFSFNLFSTKTTHTGYLEMR